LKCTAHSINFLCGIVFSDKLCNLYEITDESKAHFKLIRHTINESVLRTLACIVSNNKNSRCANNFYLQKLKQQLHVCKLFGNSFMNAVKPVYYSCMPCFSVDILYFFFFWKLTCINNGWLFQVHNSSHCCFTKSFIHSLCCWPTIFPERLFLRNKREIMWCFWDVK